MDEYQIYVNNITVRFNLASQKVDNLKEYIIKLIKKELFFEEFFAIKDVTLKIKKGESWGIIGRNGSGKSTLLKVICGILEPYKGEVKTKGIIAPLLELGAGFDTRLTARENIYLNGALLGFSRDYINQKYEEIVEFSELQKFIDVSLNSFSSGMRARLGFSIATIVEPEILIVDEVLSVGDKLFREKCDKKMEKLLKNGTTLIYVSHSISDITKMCDKSILLDHGKVVSSGLTKNVIRDYSTLDLKAL